MTGSRLGPATGLGEGTGVAVTGAQTGPIPSRLIMGRVGWRERRVLCVSSRSGASRRRFSSS